MIALPPGWIHHFGVNRVTAYPPEGGVRFRYHERLCPSPSFSEIVRDILNSDPEFRVNAVSEMVRTVTVEGEYGAWVAVDGRRAGAPAMRFVGAVFMGEFATALDGLATRPDRFGETEVLSRQLLCSSRHEMRRPRRFFYVPPVGWQGVPSGMTANWYPPDFPGNRTTIVVPPARSVDGSARRAIEEVFSRAGAGLEVEDSARSEITTASGVTGTALRLRGSRGETLLHREVAAFAIEPWIYWMRFETSMADRLLDLREVFKGVAGSFRPLPGAEEIRVGRAYVSTSDVFEHWAS